MNKVILKFLMLAIIVFANATVSQAVAEPEAQHVTEKVVSLASGNIQFLESGSGSTLVILLHGFPETNHEWHKVMPILAGEYKVVAVNLPGIGKSDAIKQFDKRTIAESIIQLIQKLEPKKVVMVGHDIGGMVAYAVARKYSDRIDALAIVDVPLPGLDPWDKIKNSVHAWHFGFHQMPMTEKILEGRERIYLEAFYERVGRNFKIPKASVDQYVKAYENPQSLMTAMGWYRAFPEDEKANMSDSSKQMSMPVLLLSNDWGGKSAPIIARKISQKQESIFVEGAGHWLPEERPEEVAGQILKFLKRHKLEGTK